MTKCLIVGGAGFIGSALIRKLGVENALVFDNFSPVVHNSASVRAFTNLGADFVVGDVTSPEDIQGLLQGNRIGTLVYLAAETGTGRSLRNCALNARVNTLGLATLLDSLSMHDALPDRIVLTSTRAVYGEGPYRDSTGTVVYPDQRNAAALDAGVFEFDGLSPLAMNAAVHFPKPINIYGSTKLSQEHILENWAAAFCVPLYIFRLQNVYGGGQSLTNPYTGVLIHFIKQAMAGEPVMIYEQGGITRDFVHVDDVAALLALAIKGGGRPGRYDCGSGKRVELEQVAAMLAEIGGAPLPELCGNYRLGDVRHACASVEATCDAFGWSTDVSLADGLASLFDFVKKRIVA